MTSCHFCSVAQHSRCTGWAWTLDGGTSRLTRCDCAAAGCPGIEDIPLPSEESA